MNGNTLFQMSVPNRGATAYNDIHHLRRATMVPRLLPAVFSLVLACTSGLQVARADIYTWIDKTGSINVSNMAPPDGIHVTNVLHESPPRVAPPRDTVAVTTRDAEMQALDERIRELEYEVELARHPAPPPAQYYAPPPSVQYYAPAAPVMQYVVNVAAPATGGCDQAWYGCGSSWWTSGFYPPSVVVVGAPAFHQPFPSHGGGNLAMQMPVHAPGGIHMH
jgi:hypothetical protein